jgi:ribose-phosphate pyrophosphokinase
MKLIFSTQKYQYLAQKLVAMGNLEAGQVEVKYFPDGERYQRLLTDVAGRDVILLGGTISDNDTLEYYDLACAIEKQGASSLVMLIPYFGYSTMERAVKKGEVVTAKSRARLLSAIPNTGKGNHVLLLDLHTEGLPHYFEGDIQPTHVYAKDLVIEACREFGGNDFTLACTDAGRAKWVESLANDMGVQAAFVFKKRLSGDSTSITGINADVVGKTVVIYDDMIRTGGSLIKAAEAYKEAGATAIYAVTTHGIFPNDALTKIKNSGLFQKLACTDSHYNVTLLEDDFLVIKSVAKIFHPKLVKDF